MFIIKIFCVIMILDSRPIWCWIHEECRGINRTDMVVASKENCTKYIFCTGMKSYEGECLAGNYFNEKTGNCDDPSNVECNIKSIDDVNDEDYNYTSNEDDDDNENESEFEITDEKDVETNEVDKNISNEIDTDDTSSDKIPKCPKLMGFHNMKQIANPKSCVSFFICYNGVAIPILCPAKMYFNEQTSKCETQMPSSCKLKNPLNINCHKGVYDYMPHPNKCEYYYYCMNGHLLIMRCAYDFTWHYKRARVFLNLNRNAITKTPLSIVITN